MQTNGKIHPPKKLMLLINTWMLDGSSCKMLLTGVNYHKSQVATISQQ